MFIRRRKVERNIDHSFSWLLLLPFALVCNAAFKAVWSVYTVKLPLPKYCGSFVNAHTRAPVSILVDQYPFSAGLSDLDRFVWNCLRRRKRNVQDRYITVRVSNRITVKERVMSVDAVLIVR